MRRGEERSTCRRLSRIDSTQRRFGHFLGHLEGGEIRVEIEVVLFQPGLAEVELASVLAVLGRHAAYGAQFHVFQRSGHGREMIVMVVYVICTMSYDAIRYHTIP